MVISMKYWMSEKSFNWMFNNMMDQINEELCQERDKGSNVSKNRSDN